MTNQEKNIAIHEYLGWERVSLGMGTFVARFSWKHKESGLELRHTPFYTNSLDAMHKAESIFEATRYAFDYIGELHATILRHAGLSTNGRCGEFRIVNATALQRAEAFLRVIGKWRD